MPVPLLGEYTADSSETAQVLGTLLGEDVTEITYLPLQGVPAVTDTGRYGTEESVLNVNRLILI